MTESKNYLSIRIHTMGDKTVKVGKQTYRSFTSMRGHIDRTEKMSEGYLINEEFKHLNIYEDYLGDNSNLEHHKARIAQLYRDTYRRKLPKNTQPYVDGLITFSTSMQEDIKDWGREALFKAIKGFLEREFGPTQGEDQAVLNLALHMDETTPHFHFTALNWDRRVNRTYSSAMSKALKDPNNPTRKSDLQDRLADWLKDWSDGQPIQKEWDYGRGENVNIKTYHSKRKAQAEHLKTLEATKVANEELLEKHETVIASQKDEIVKHKKDVDALKEEIKTLEENYAKKLKDLEEQYANEVEEKSHLLEDINRLEGERAALAQKILERFVTIPKLQGPFTAIKYIVKALDKEWREENAKLVTIAENMAKGQGGGGRPR
jgi:DNA repair exonuclease SbcCD ATPase subunit